VFGYFVHVLFSFIESSLKRIKLYNCVKIYFFLLITETVLKLIPLCTETEIIISIKNWLRHATKRHENRYYIHEFITNIGAYYNETSITQISRGQKKI